MILDEVNSSIDTRTEKLVQEDMDRLMEGSFILEIRWPGKTGKELCGEMLQSSFGVRKFIYF